MVIAVLLDAYLLYIFFKTRKPAAVRSEAV